MLEAGADIVDVGGQSTRPGAVKISAAQEAERVSSVIEYVPRTSIAVSQGLLPAYTDQGIAKTNCCLGRHATCEVFCAGGLLQCLRWSSQ